MTKKKESALYVDIYERIMQSIQSGEYPENSPLPSERFFCEKYHVSRYTIRQALLMLKEADAIYSVHGHGSFIKPQVFMQPLTKFYSFTDTLKSSHVLIHNDVISYELVSADASMSRKTGYPEGTVFHKLVRLRSAKDYPLNAGDYLSAPEPFFEVGP